METAKQVKIGAGSREKSTCRMAVLMEATGGSEGEMRAVVGTQKGIVMHKRLGGATALGVRGQRADVAPEGLL